MKNKEILKKCKKNRKKIKKTLATSKKSAKMHTLSSDTPA